MKIAFITTVLNEEKNIKGLLNSISSQTKRPDEIFIVDGGSNDRTVKVIKEWVSNLRSKKLKKRIKLIGKNGNRSIGRNEAINRTSCEIIVCSDAGCVLDRNWVKNITKPFKKIETEVVAGFYKGFPKSVFEKSLIPYILIMPDRVKPESFIPSARSMAFRKEIWRKVGGFPSNFSNNEDYVFGKKLKEFNARIVFKKNAIVYFLPRENLIQSFHMFFRFATGDAEAGILRPKVVLVFIRYAIAVWLLIYAYYFKLFFIVEVIFYILLVYILWAILKNYKYVRQKEALLFLPLLQITSDIAVIIGTAFGFLRGLWDTQEK